MTDNNDNEKLSTAVAMTNSMIGVLTGDYEEVRVNFKNLKSIDIHDLGNAGFTLYQICMHEIWERSKEK